MRGQHDNALFSASSKSSAINLIELIDLLQIIVTNSPIAGLNALSISDNNGGRIRL